MGGLSKSVETTVRIRYIDLSLSMPAINEIKNTWERRPDIIRGKLNLHSKVSLVFRDCKKKNIIIIIIIIIIIQYIQ